MGQFIKKVPVINKKKKVFSIWLLVYFILFWLDNFFAMFNTSTVNIMRVFICVLGYVPLLRKKISKLNVIFLSFLLWIVFVQIINRIPLLDWNFTVLKYTSVCIVIDYYIRRNNARYVLNSFSIANVIFFALNFVISPYELGLYSNFYEVISPYYGRTLWLIGHRNAFAGFFVISTLTLYLASKKLRHGNVLVIIWILGSLLMSIHVWSATGIVLCILMFTGIIFIKSYQLNIIQSLFVGTIFNIAITILKIQEWFAFIIVDLLHRNLLFTGRTYVWDFYMQQIVHNPVVGKGIEEAYVPFLLFVRGPHNGLITILYAYGIIGLFLFLFAFFISNALSKEFIITNEMKTISYFTLLLLIRITFESDYSPLFFCLILAYHVPNLVEHPVTQAT